VSFFRFFFSQKSGKNSKIPNPGICNLGLLFDKRAYSENEFETSKFWMSNTQTLTVVWPQQDTTLAPAKCGNYRALFRIVALLLTFINYS
jgi:hypothetical protein